MAASKSTDKSGDAKTRKIIDVSEPGKTAPPTSSRPIIVSNRPILRRDPMMASPDGMEKEEAPEEKPVARTSKPILKISPLTPEEKPAEAPASAAPAQKTAETSAPAQAVAVPVPAAPTPPAASKTAASVAEGDLVDDDDVAVKPATDSADEDFKLEGAADTSTPKPETKQVEVSPPAAATATQPTPPMPSEPEPPMPPVPPATSSVSDSDDDEEDTDGQLAPNQTVDVAKRKEEDAQAVRQAEQEKIIESKQYFLPINTVEKRRGMERFILLLLVVIVVALVWLDIALDAGILRLGGIHSLTHFFKS